jgi:flagellar biosynthesis protein FlhG
LGENIVHFALASSALIIVTTPEPTARMDAYALIKTAHARNPELDLQVLVNEVSGEKEAHEVIRGLSRVCREHLSSAPHYLGFVPRDEHVPRSVSQRSSFVLRYPRAPASKAIERVGDKIQKLLLPYSGGLEDRQRSSFLTRLFSAFSGRSA